MKELELKSELTFPAEVNASITDNPTVSNIKFVFTDNQPNANKKGVPSTAFPSLIKSGLLMPIKMAQGAIAEGHDGATPLGVISSLITAKDSADSPIEKVLGDAAVWAEERPQDIQLLKEAYASGQKLNISWELLYTDSTIDSNGVEWINDPIVRGATIVGAPAYRGRTPIMEVASEELYKNEQADMEESAVWTTAYINNLPDSAFLYVEPGGTKDSEGKTVPRSLRHFPYKDENGKIDRPHLTNAIARIPQSSISDSLKTKLQAKARNLLAKLNGVSSTMDELELQAKIDSLQNENTALKKEIQDTIVAKELELNKQAAELSSLKEFKASVEKKEAEAALLKSRLSMFASKNINFTPEEIEAKKSMWLKLDDEAFSYLISELDGRVVHASASTNRTTVPGTITTGNEENLEDIVRKGLKEMNSAQK